MLNSISSNGCDIHFNDKAYTELNHWLTEKNYSKIFVLVDEKTHAKCLPTFLGKLNKAYDMEVIEIEAGEQHKQIETCSEVWKIISDLGGDRKSLLINLGGGVVTDLGGFVGATYMRGIDFLNIPTTLLAMVDASVGGKTGVDLGPLKNQVGVIINPVMVLIDIEYLGTLPKSQLRSGLAEMLKHGLIYDEKYWNQLRQLDDLSLDDLDALIHRSVVIKNEVVTEDPREVGLRKILNFGHTLGHAIESFFLENPNKKTLLHGEAIAIGMIMETYLSTQLTDFPENKLEEIKHTFLNYFEKVDIEENDIPEIIKLMRFDKKNAHGNINFVLLKSISKPVLDVTVNNDLIISALEYYKK
ncbi:3-dehydroquinate synthase [Galbibacter sp. EGI 63066]|uniref:3-dehydroquinate synthase n=1 Tax=Galbibacter sp. EGI 63066 TaxID=2993559 RepID=UPI0022487BD0|nr:3-dehydroquinate synthase [Galbibacter sp. EGI 63066]MCX2680800.1 3-dehydroquinate synthase [Galbibacter sp. EGI 63066]